MSSPGSEFHEKTVLITGGTGSFGQVMARRLLSQGCGEVRIFSRDECKQEQMRVKFSDPRLRFYIGNVRDRSSVDAAMQGINLVFHAAALKQVPSCEFFPMQAVETNIIGSRNVLESAVSQSVDCVVMLSTDKAVYPVNAMGMTKAVMEKVAQSVARRLKDGSTRICAVRYGNVLCSRGSVVPLFVSQVLSGKPITVTSKEMSRFMMPLDDSVELVEFAFQHAKQGDVFVKKAAACTIGTLAQAVLEIFGSDTPVTTIGVRHGEKMFETLASAAEVQRSESIDGFLRIPMDERDLNYNRYFIEGEDEISSTLDYDSHTTDQLTLEEVKQLLLHLPEMQPDLIAQGIISQ